MNDFDRAACAKFSQLRERKHITSYNDKWNLEGVCSANTLLRYSSGQASFMDMPFYLAVASFKFLDYRPDDFMLENFPIRDEFNIRVSSLKSSSVYDWLGDHSRPDYEYLREKAKNRIFALKKRGSIDSSMYDSLLDKIKEVFSLENCLSDSRGRYLSDEYYISHVVPLVHEIDKASILGSTKIDVQGKFLRCVMIDKDLSIDDISYLADISRRAFFYLQKDMNKIGHLPFSKIICICLALDKKYDELFSIYLENLSFI